MTPADLRALAARVETYEPSEAMWFEVRNTMYPMPRGYGPEHERHLHLLARLGHLIRNGHLLEFAAGLMPVGWRVNVFQRAEPEGWFVEAGSEAHGEVFAQAPDEERARTAAALRAMAAGMEVEELKPSIEVPVVMCPKCGMQAVAFVCSERGCPVNGGAFYG